MEKIRKLFGAKPNVGDSVAGYLDFGIKYEGVVIETAYQDEIMPGAFVLGKVIFSIPWNTEVIGDRPRFFVPLPRLKHS